MRSSLGEPEKVGNTVDDMSLQRVAVTHHFRFLCTVRATTSQRHVEANNRFVFAVNDQFKFVRVNCVTCRGDRIMSRRQGFDCTKITQYTRKARRFCAVLLQCRKDQILRNIFLWKTIILPFCPMQSYLKDLFFLWLSSFTNLTLWTLSSFNDL